uniref:ABC transporter ATP-binding protein n=1 Tax=candidate division WOR-3 bacterium TaxID=2052148 RepID=A0A7V3VUX8_UNCW3
MRELLALKKYFRRYSWQIIIGIIALIIIDLLQLFVPRVLKLAVDALAQGRATMSLLGYYFLLIMLIAIGIAFGRFWWRYLLIGSARRIEKELRGDFYNHLTMLDLSFFDTHKTGDLMAHAVNDINAIRMSIGFGLVILVDIFALGVASLVMMIMISPRLTFYALLPFPFIAFFSTYFGRFIHRLFEKVQESFSNLTERVRENLSGIRVVKLFVQEDAEIEKFKRTSEDYVNKNMKLWKILSLFFPIIMGLAGIGEVIVLGLGGRYVIIGAISVGSFVAFMVYLQMMVWPMMAIGRAINMFQRGAASQGRLNRIFSIKPSIKGGEKNVSRDGAKIEYKNITFTYPGKEKPALSNITLEIETGSFIGITGPIGSGKSSLVHLLLRLYEPQDGTIFLNGIDIKEYNLAELRKSIAFVPQDTFLFSDTIKENILFGNPRADMSDVENVARIAEIYDEVMEFPQGFETIVGERGITLSGGQKQRIALARALVLKRPILILDDAFSAVDANTEQKIVKNLKSELTNRTTIIISHRLFAIKEAKMIIVLDEGKIVEKGTHQELIKQRGLYYSIYKTQQLEMKLEKI